MYTILLFLHSLFRWLVVSSLLYAILRAYVGVRSYRAGRLYGVRGSFGTGRLSGMRRLFGIRRLFGVRRLFGTAPLPDGLQAGRAFTKTDDAIRHWTATIAHIQLMLGCALYFTSPLIKLFYSSDRTALVPTTARRELSFFGVIHSSLLLTAIVIITIGSALAKRKEASRDKFATMLQWFSIAGVLILVAIPWPWSPLASRPLFRTF